MLSNLPQNLAQFRKKTKKASCQKFVVSSSINKNLAPKSGFGKVWKILLLNYSLKNSSKCNDEKKTSFVLCNKSACVVYEWYLFFWFSTWGARGSTWTWISAIIPVCPFFTTKSPIISSRITVKIFAVAVVHWNVAVFQIRLHL